MERKETQKMECRTVQFNFTTFSEELLEREGGKFVPDTCFTVFLREHIQSGGRSFATFR